MPRMQGVPEGFAPVIVAGKVRLVPKDGNRAKIVATDIGYGVGRVGSVAVTPFEALGALASDIGASAFGQGVKWGWVDGQRGKAVSAATKVHLAGDEKQVRNEIAKRGLVDPGTAATMDLKAAARLLAESSIEHPFFDENSAKAPIPEVAQDTPQAKPSPAPASSTGMPEAVKAALAAAGAAVRGEEGQASASGA